MFFFFNKFKNFEEIERTLTNKKYRKYFDKDKFRNMIVYDRILETIKNNTKKKRLFTIVNNVEFEYGILKRATKQELNDLQNVDLIEERLVKINN